MCIVLIEQLILYYEINIMIIIGNKYFFWCGLSQTVHLYS